MLDAEDTHDEKLLGSLKTMEKVKKQLEHLGIKEPDPPDSDAPDVPADIEQVSDSELGNLNSKLLEHYNFATYQLALAQGRKAECGNSMKYVKAAMKERKIKDLDAHPEYVMAVKDYQEADQMVTMLEAYKHSLSKRMAVVSRDVERRKLEWEKHSRTGSIGRMRHDVDHVDASRRWKVGK